MKMNFYDFNGKFTGLIHDKFSFCKNHDLPMPFEPAVTGWLSATDTLKELFNWFTEDDIKKLEQYGYELTIYEATEFKFHNNHWLINQESSKPKGTIKLRNSKTFIKSKLNRWDLGLV